MVKYVLEILDAFVAGTLLVVFTYFVFLANIQFAPLANLGGNGTNTQNGDEAISHLEHEDITETVESATDKAEKWELAFYLFPDMDNIVSCPTSFMGYHPGGSEIVFRFELDLAPDGTISGSRHKEYDRSNVSIEGNGIFIDHRLKLTGEFEREDNTDYELKRGDWETGSCTYQPPELADSLF